MRKLISMMVGLYAAQASQLAGAASDVVENTQVIAGANVGASAPAFWLNPDGSWDWFGAPMLGLAALLILLWLWRRRKP